MKMLILVLALSGCAESHRSDQANGSIATFKACMEGRDSQNVGDDMMCFGVAEGTN